MKGIQDDTRTVTTSTSMNSDWPIENILDPSPQKYAKASDNTQTIIIDLMVHDYYGGSGSLYIGNTNAKTGTLKVYNSAKSVLYETFSLSFVGVSFFNFLTQRYIEQFSENWQDYTYRSAVLNLELTLVTDVLSDIVITNGGSGYESGTLSASGGGISGFFGTYTVDDAGTVDSVHIIDHGTGITDIGSVVISLSDSGGSGIDLTAQSTVNCGICRAGYAKEFRNPSYGFNESFKDYSIVKKYFNGAEYYKRRGISRIFSGEITIVVEEIGTFNDLMRQARQEPIAINLLNNEQRGILFGKITALPTNKRTKLKQFNSSLKITEVL